MQNITPKKEDTANRAKQNTTGHGESEMEKHPDTEQLDWIIDQLKGNGRVEFRFYATDGEGGEPFFDCRLGNNYNSDFKGYAGKTLRAAIDAAMGRQS